MVFEQYCCPECEGTGLQQSEEILFGNILHGIILACWFCEGTGYATDDGSEEEIIIWE